MHCGIEIRVFVCLRGPSEGPAAVGSLAWEWVHTHTSLTAGADAALISLFTRSVLDSSSSLMFRRTVFLKTAIFQYGSKAWSDPKILSHRVNKIKNKTIKKNVLLTGPYHTPGAMQRAGLKMRCVQARCYLKQLKYCTIDQLKPGLKYFLYIAFPKLKGPSQWQKQINNHFISRWTIVICQVQNVRLQLLATVIM